MYKQIGKIEESVSKAAGSPLDFRRYPIPPDTSLIKWFATHTGGTAIRHSASPRYDALTSDGNFVTTFGDGDAKSYFSTSAAAPPGVALGETLIGGGTGETANRFEWVFTADAANPTKFFLRLLFFTTDERTM